MLSCPIGALIADRKPVLFAQWIVWQPISLEKQILGAATQMAAGVGCLRDVHFQGKAYYHGNLPIF
jgi:hypothetical protein